MKRTSLVTGCIIPALLAVVPACDDPFTCPGAFLECSAGTCVDIATSDQHCGACGVVCESGQHCEASTCVADAVVCTAPEQSCGGGCVDTQTSPAHCGACDDPCPSSFADCVGGECAAPLIAMQTSRDDRQVDRDLHVLRDLTFALTRINDTAFTTPRVIDHVVLPDGRLLLVAAQTEGVFELFLASPRGGALTRVSGALTAGGDVQPGVVVSADGTRVLYRADQDTDDVLELYAVALASPGAAVKVSGTLTAGGGVSRVFALSADGRRAAYLADAETDARDELYTVDLSAAAPGAPVKLNPAVTDSLWDFALTPDGARVVYRATDPGTGRLQLNVVSVAAPGTATPITYADGAEGHVEAYRLSPDGTALAFTGGSSFLNESLWYLDLAPPYAATRLADGSGNAGGGDYDWVRGDFAFTPDGDHILLRKVAGAFGFDRLFRVDVATPGALVQLSAAGDTSAEEVTDFVLSPDGRHVVFRGGADGAEGGSLTPGTAEPPAGELHAPALYHVDLTATAPAPALLSPPATVGREGIGGGYVVTGDSARVVYRADDDVLGFSDAYLVALASAGAARKVSPPLDQQSDATDVSLISRY